MEEGREREWILKSSRTVVQNEYGLTFAFVGQDMAAMRQSWADLIGVANRDGYWWKDPTVEVAPSSAQKVSRRIRRAQRQLGS
jgi:hypothetical protein